jgi:hypothetical protein
MKMGAAVSSRTLATFINMTPHSEDSDLQWIFHLAAYFRHPNYKTLQHA